MLLTGAVFDTLAVSVTSVSRAQQLYPRVVFLYSIVWDLLCFCGVSVNPSGVCRGNRVTVQFWGHFSEAELLHKELGNVYYLLTGTGKIGAAVKGCHAYCQQWYWVKYNLIPTTAKPNMASQITQLKQAGQAHRLSQHSKDRGASPGLRWYSG